MTRWPGCCGNPLITDCGPGGRNNNLNSEHWHGVIDVTVFHIAHAQKRQFLRLSLLAALEVVKMITSSAAGDGSFVAATTLSFRCCCVHSHKQIFTWFIYNLMNVPSSVVTISPILVLTYVPIMSVKRTNGIIQSLKQQCGHGDYSPVVGFSSDCHYWN